MTQEQVGGDLARRVEGLEAFRRRVLRDSWLGAVLRSGGRPTLPVVDTLPTATPAMAFQMVTVRGAAGVADVSYQCLKNAAGVYDWRVVATG